MLSSEIEWDTGMSDPEHMEHMEAAEQEWEEPDRHYILHDIIVCSLNKILRCLWLVLCIHTCTITAAGWMIFCSSMSAYKNSFD